MAIYPWLIASMPLTLLPLLLTVSSHIIHAASIVHSTLPSPHINVHSSTPAHDRSNPHQRPRAGGGPVTSGPYIVMLPDSPLNRAMYVELTRFHAAMYFSMQPVTHVCSELESEDPGLETHLSKQVDLRFCVLYVSIPPPQLYISLQGRVGPGARNVGFGRKGEELGRVGTYVHELLGVGHGRLRPYLLDDGVLDRVGVHGVGGGVDRFRMLTGVGGGGYVMRRSLGGLGGSSGSRSLKLRDGKFSRVPVGPDVIAVT